MDKLDSHLVTGRFGRAGYYLVIPFQDETFADPAVLDLLNQKIPNLPRFLLGARDGDSPFRRVDHADTVTQHFWGLKELLETQTYGLKSP